jgi:hypothetical protein
MEVDVMARLSMPQIRPTPMVVPTKQYPWLKGLMKQVDYACPSCSAGSGQPVYHTLEESILDPLSGAPTELGAALTEKGLVATRFLVMCPETRCVPENNPLIPNGYCDLMQISPNYKRPFRPVGDQNSITYDGDEEDAKPAVKVRKFGSGKLKKASEINPKSLPLTAKARRLIKAARASNKEAVPADALQPSQRKSKG